MLEEAEEGSKVLPVWRQGTRPLSQTARTRLAAAIDDVPKHLGAALPEALGVGRGVPQAAVTHETVCACVSPEAF